MPFAQDAVSLRFRVDISIIPKDITKIPEINWQKLNNSILIITEFLYARL